MRRSSYNSAFLNSYSSLCLIIKSVLFFLAISYLYCFSRRAGSISIAITKYIRLHVIIFEKVRKIENIYLPTGITDAPNVLPRTTLRSYIRFYGTIFLDLKIYFQTQKVVVILHRVTILLSE